MTCHTPKPADCHTSECEHRTAVCHVYRVTPHGLITITVISVIIHTSQCLWHVCTAWLLCHVSWVHTSLCQLRWHVWHDDKCFFRTCSFETVRHTQVTCFWVVGKLSRDARLIVRIINRQLRWQLAYVCGWGVCGCVNICGYRLISVCGRVNLYEHYCGRFLWACQLLQG